MRGRRDDRELIGKDSFFAGQMHVFRPRTDLARVLLALAPLIGAALIAISRCEDYRHDVWDVTTGSGLGISIAYFSYRRYYRSLRSHVCHEPYPSQSESATSSSSGKLKDEEARIRGVGDYSEDGLDESEHLPLRETSTDRRGVNRGNEG